MRRTVLVLLVLAVMLAAAPTMIPLGMLAAPALSGGGVMAVAPTGQVVVAQLGVGISLVNSNNVWTIQAMQPREVYSIKPAMQPNGTYTLTDAAIAATLRVYRNGVRQSPGDDFAYDLSSKTVSPVAANPWGASDLILCDYQF
jgi:hypothetical protein